MWIMIKSKKVEGQVKKAIWRAAGQRRKRAKREINKLINKGKHGVRNDEGCGDDGEWEAVKKRKGGLERNGIFRVRWHAKSAVLLPPFYLFLSVFYLFIFFLVCNFILSAFVIFYACVCFDLIKRACKLGWSSIF